MIDMQHTQNTKNERRRGAISRVGNFLIKVLTEGLGAAFGVAIVAFVAFTVMGVYSLKTDNESMQKTLKTLTENVQFIERQQSQLDMRLMEEKTERENRSSQLREEIIESNQVALQMVLDKINKDKDDSASTPQLFENIVGGAKKDPKIIDGESKLDIEADALKYRFRQAQQKVQQQWKN